MFAVKEIKSSAEKWMAGKLRQGLGCGLDVVCCGSDMDNKADAVPATRY